LKVLKALLNKTLSAVTGEDFESLLRRCRFSKKNGDKGAFKGKQGFVPSHHHRDIIGFAINDP